METVEVQLLLFVWVMAFMKGCIAGWLRYQYVLRRNIEIQEKVDERE